jgi:TonB family protein
MKALTFSVAGQSGRVKESPKKPPVVPVPVDAAGVYPSVAEGPKKPGQPKFVDGERIYSGREVDVKARILKKPEPSGTAEARRHSFRGKVVLQAILAANGQVTNITLIAGLPYGLNQKSLAAAQLIKFEPAMKDGKAVSEWVRIEYTFWFI